MGISNAGAQKQAIELAEAFLSSKEFHGYTWKCVEARPDLMAGDIKHRKAYVKWAVVVDYSRNGAVIDGPGIILVDILKKECRFFGADGA